MLHVSRHEGLTIAVSEAKYVAHIARRTDSVTIRETGAAAGAAAE
jgi:hypothetical protein